MPSSVIRNYRYAADDKRLDIQFVSGRRYSYYEVPEKVYEGMKQTTGKGEYFNAHIRDHYRFTRNDS